MSSSKRPSTSSLRRFITSRPYIPVAEIRRRFGIDDPDCMCRVQRGDESAFVGLPEREALKVEELWNRHEIGLEMSVEVRAPVVVGIYPMRMARYVMDAGQGQHTNGPPGNGQHAEGAGVDGRERSTLAIGGLSAPPATTSETRETREAQTHRR
jgi:hypothetical protein